MKGMSRGLAIALMLCSAGAWAHHSFAAFDLQNTVEIQGVLKEVKFSNPHSWFIVTVTDASGATADWAVEGLSPTAMIAQGIKRSAFKAGDKVNVTLNPLRAGGTGGSLVSVKLSDGSVVKGGPGQ